MKVGLHQGSVLSILLFAMVMDVVSSDTWETLLMERMERIFLLLLESEMDRCSGSFFHF